MCFVCGSVCASVNMRVHLAHAYTRGGQRLMLGVLYCSLLFDTGPLTEPGGHCLYEP